MCKTFLNKISKNVIKNSFQNLSPLNYNNLTQLTAHIILSKLGYHISVITIILLFL